MSVAIDLSAAGLEWGSVVRPRTVEEARELVARFDLERAERVQALYEAMRGDGVQDPERERERREWNRRVREMNRQAGDKELRDRIDRGETVNPLDRESVWGERMREEQSSAYQGCYRQYQRSELAMLRAESDSEFERLMNEDTPEAWSWREREREVLNVRSALREHDDPFGDPPAVGAFGFVAVDVAEGPMGEVVQLRSPARRKRQPSTVKPGKRTTAGATGGYAAYVRVSTALQGDSGLGLEAQERAIMSHAAAHGLTVSEQHREVVSGAASKLPVRDELLARCRSGELAGIVVAKIDRVSRSMIDLLGIAEDAERHGYRVVIAQQSITLPEQSAHGRMFLGVLALMAEFERDMISERTREGLASARARGKRLGHASKLPVETCARIRELAHSGMGPSMIARVLNDERVGSASGKPWRHSMVNEVLRRMG